MTQVCISFGSNIGDREFYINEAVSSIRSVGLISEVKLSRMLSTKALLKSGSPKSWDRDFLNCVLIGNTSLGPHSLLEELLRIERRVGGLKRSWEPRKLDIDILLYGDLCFSASKLTVPHPELRNRQFLVELIREVSSEFYNLKEGSYAGEEV